LSEINQLQNRLALGFWARHLRPESFEALLALATLPVYGLAFGRFTATYMSGTTDPSEQARIEDRHQQIGHPRGTLAIVIIFGALVILGWLAMYLFLFLQRGAPHS